MVNFDGKIVEGLGDAIALEILQAKVENRTVDLRSQSWIEFIHSLDHLSSNCFDNTPRSIEGRNDKSFYLPMEAQANDGGVFKVKRETHSERR